MDIKIKAGVEGVIGCHLLGESEIDGGVGLGVLLNEFVVDVAFITNNKTLGVGR